MARAVLGWRAFIRSRLAASLSIRTVASSGRDVLSDPNTKPMARVDAMAAPRPFSHRFHAIRSSVVSGGAHTARA
jgi:hypothetical protein